jgi:3-hydroxymyristoyl/3-hydroxydecanoyl-(acyl carrier protein) dehydratase
VLLDSYLFLLWTRCDTLWYLLTNDARQEQGQITARITTEEQSPWFAGHFPDDPVLPGIAQLKMVADVIGMAGGEDLQVSGLSRVKFRRIVRPGDQLDIHAAPGKMPGQYAFRITCGPDEVCSGMMYFISK